MSILEAYPVSMKSAASVFKQNRKPWLMAVAKYHQKPPDIPPVARHLLYFPKHCLWYMCLIACRTNSRCGRISSINCFTCLQTWWLVLHLGCHRVRNKSFDARFNTESYKERLVRTRRMGTLHAHNYSRFDTDDGHGRWIRTADTKTGNCGLSFTPVYLTAFNQYHIKLTCLARHN